MRKQLMFILLSFLLMMPVVHAETAVDGKTQEKSEAIQQSSAGEAAEQEDEAEEEEILQTAYIQLQIDNPLVTVDYQDIEVEAAPFLYNDTTLVPLRVITTAFGAIPEWNGETQTIQLQYAATNVQLTIGKTEALVNGEPVEMLAAPQLIQSTTMVPLRFISETFGASVQFDQESLTIIIEGLKLSPPDEEKATEEAGEDAAAGEESADAEPVKKEISPKNKTMILVGREGAPEDAAIAKYMRSIGFRVTVLPMQYFEPDKVKAAHVVFFSMSINEKYIKDGQMKGVAVPQLYAKGIGMTALGLSGGRHEKGKETKHGDILPARVASVSLSFGFQEKMTEDGWKSLGDLAVWCIGQPE